MLLLKSLLHLLEFCLFYILNRNSIIPKITLIWQENQRYKRYFQQKKIKHHFSIQEKWFIRTMFISNPEARRYFTLVTPETILYRWKRTINNYWTFDKSSTRRKGRPPITKAMKLLIKNMKIDNYLWGCKRIQDELEKVSIDISRETIRKVIQDYREMVHYNITRNPNIKFLRRQFSYFEESYPDSYLIHDNSGEMKSMVLPRHPTLQT